MGAGVLTCTIAARLGLTNPSQPRESPVDLSIHREHPSKRERPCVKYSLRITHHVSCCDMSPLWGFGGEFVGAGFLTCTITARLGLTNPSQPRESPVDLPIHREHPSKRERSCVKYSLRITHHVSCCDMSPLWGFGYLVYAACYKHAAPLGLNAR